MANIILEFTQEDELVLDLVTFSHPLLESSRISRRGKGTDNVFGRYSFQWTPAVKALCLLLLKTKAGFIDSHSRTTNNVAVISGGAGSFAASLDYAISKRPAWLLDMFGINSFGTSIARSLFLRWNSERKKGGDVLIATNPNQLGQNNIAVILNNKILNCENCLNLAVTLEDSNRESVDALQICV